MEGRWFHNLLCVMMITGRLTPASCINPDETKDDHILDNGQPLSGISIDVGPGQLEDGHMDTASQDNGPLADKKWTPNFIFQKFAGFFQSVVSTSWLPLAKMMVFKVKGGERNGTSVVDSAGGMNQTGEEDTLAGGKNASGQLAVGESAILADSGEEDEGNSTSNRNKQLNCLLPNVTTGIPQVEIANASMLSSILDGIPNITQRTELAPCVILFLYAPWCPFSIKASPHFNALPRAFPGLRFVASEYSNFNNPYIVLAVPMVLIFHNGRPISSLNDSVFALEQFASFVTGHTGIQPVGLLNVTLADFLGPAPTRIETKMDVWLWVSYAFVLVVLLRLLFASSIWRRLVESVRTTWREVEAQNEHEHVE